jgi:hypothetical protein
MVTGAFRPLGGKQLARDVEDCCAPSTIATVAIDRTDEPGPTATEVTRRPGDRHSLLDRFPLARTPASQSIAEKDDIPFRAHANAARGLFPPRPRAGKVLPGAKAPISIPAAHVDRGARLARGTTTIGGPSHQLTSTELSKSFGKCIEYLQTEKRWTDQASDGFSTRPFALLRCSNHPSGRSLQ